MEFLGLLLIAAIAWFAISNVYKGYKTGRNGGATRHCMSCGIDAEPKTATRGSIWIELVLWLCFIVPGLIYSIWRMTTRYEQCPSCGGVTLVPTTSPVAQAHKKTLSA